MELNGLANLKVLMDELSTQLPNDDRLLIPMSKMYQQLELMNRYMVAYHQWSAGEIKLHNEEYQHVTKTRPPYWHEILANPKQFPTNHEVLNGSKQKEPQKV